MRRLQWAWACIAIAALASLTQVALADDESKGLKSGAVALESAGPMTFGPDGVLFVGDPKAAKIYAIATGDEGGDPAKVKLNIDKFDKELATAVGAGADPVVVNDLAVNPASGNLYFSLAIGAKKTPAIVKLDAAGKITKLSLDKIDHSSAALTDAPESREGGRRGNPRDESITDLAFNESKLIVSGQIAGESTSAVRELVFPFGENASPTRIEIYHAAHGRSEDYAVVRTLVPFTIDGKPTLLAGFTCTPLVSFPLESLKKAGEKVKGTTVAELGNRNRPLDMIVYRKNDKTFVLMSNSARGVMKISTEKLHDQKGLNEPVRGGGTAGLPFETVADLAGIEQMDRLDDARGIAIVKTDGGIKLRTFDLP